MPPEPTQTVSNGDHSHIFVVRQYIAYQKEVVILAPTNSYPPAAPQTVAFANSVQPMQARVSAYETDHPELQKTTQTWSSAPSKPKFFQNKALQDHPVKYPEAPQSKKNSGGYKKRGGHSNAGQGRKRRRGGNTDSEN